MRLSVSASDTTPAVGSTFAVTTRVSSPSYVVGGVHLRARHHPIGVTLEKIVITREDGVKVEFTGNNSTLGDIVQGDSRTATWRFRVISAGRKTLQFRAWSNNGGEVTQSVTITP